MALQLITPPAVQPISLAEAKAHLRVDHTDEDTLIELLIQAATAYADGAGGFLGRALVTQTWDLVLDEFPADWVMIPLPPLQEVLSVEYDDSSGFLTILDPSEYTVDTANEPGWVAIGAGGWPTPFDGINSIRIRFVAGYAPTADSPPDLTANIPGNIKAGLLLTIGHLYATREQVIVGQTVAQLPWGADQLFRRHRVVLGMA